MATPAGAFVWYELMTSDPDAAATFYSKVVGWTAAASTMPDMEYTLLNAGPDQVAGIMAIPDEAKAMGAQPGWMGYIAVADVDAAAARIVAAGGKLHRPADDIPGIGRFAVMSDPQGAGFIIFRGTPGDEAPAAAPNAAGHVGWHELNAADGPAAFAFYAGQFGWEKHEAMDMGPAGVYQLFGVAGSKSSEQSLGGMMTKPPEVPHPHWMYYFNVEGIDAAVERIGAGGGKVVHGPQEVPGGSWIVNAVDPQGAMFALVAPKR